MKLKTKFNIILIVVVIALILPTFLDASFNLRFVISEANRVYFLMIFIAAAVVRYWAQRNIITPLEKLQEATKNVANGNLNFEIIGHNSDEIGRLCCDFNEMRNRIKENIDSKAAIDESNRELITNISHDLKTPMTTIRGYVEGIMDGVADSPEKMDRYIKTIYNKVNEMDVLINELTLYSKIDLNRIPYDFIGVSAKLYFSDCAEDLLFELEEEGIGFIYYHEITEGVYVYLDHEQLRRVISNIISNAVKYMDKDVPVITFRIRDADDYIQVEISDNGMGISEKDLPNIFERLYRADASRTSYRGGSGIGLAIARKIIVEHGGKIWAESTLGEGTTIFFTIKKVKGGIDNE